MIGFIHGILRDVLPTQVTIEVQGIGYDLLIPLSSFEKLPVSGQEVKLLTHLVVREDAHLLYGFFTAAERELFRMLINNVTGIGPKIALNILSGISVNSFRAAVLNGDFRSLSQISGVGKKTAERMVVELKDKVGLGHALVSGGPQKILSAADQKLNDAVLALTALGFKQLEAQEAIRAASAMLGSEAGVEDLVRASLKKGG